MYRTQFLRLTAVTTTAVVVAMTLLACQTLGVLTGQTPVEKTPAAIRYDVGKGLLVAWKQFNQVSDLYNDLWDAKAVKPADYTTFADWREGVFPKLEKAYRTYTTTKVIPDDVTAETLAQWSQELLVFLLTVKQGGQP